MSKGTASLADASDAITVEPPLATRTKFFWGMAGFGAEALRQSRNAWLIYFYTSAATSDQHTRLSLTLVSVLLFSGKLIESFVDPLIGHLSDRTSSRFGRRIPFVLMFTLPMALLFALLFVPPAHAGHLGTAVYFFIILESFFLLNSLVSVPFEALMPEIARTSPDRVSLSAWRVYFGIAGAAIGLIGSGLLISQFGFRTMAVTIALLAMVTRYAGIAGIWPSVERSQPETVLPFMATFRLIMRNRRFIEFLLSIVFFLTGLTMVIELLPFYVTNMLHETNAGLWSSLLTAVGIGAMAAAIPFFARMGHRSSKEHAYRRAMILSACAFPVLFVAGALPGIARDLQALIAMIIVGVPLAGVYLFPGPIIADFCDADARVHGMRREGMFYSVQTFTDKLIEAFAPLLLGLVLLLGNQPDNLLGIRLVGPVAGLLVLAGYLLLRSNESRSAPES